MNTRTRTSITIRFLLVIFILVGMLGVDPIGIAHASTLVVTNTNDSGIGSLRLAIANASSGDTITFDSSLAGQTIVLSSTLNIDKSLTINGSGLSQHIQINGDTDQNGTGNVLIILINPDVIVNLIGLDIVKGYGGWWGGGIQNNGGKLFVSQSTFISNRAIQRGGAIYNGGELVVERSTFYNNVAQTDLFYDPYGKGGAIYNEIERELTITNSTFFFNYAYIAGNGVYNAEGGVARLINNTVYGLHNELGTLYLRNNIIVDCKNNGGIILENINNLINLSPADACGTPAINGDPLLASALADNGGPTQTLALLSGSPAINAGNNAFCPTIDQRGITRPQDSHCDIGAYEFTPVVHYVKWNAMGANNGSSWADAYTNLQSALAAASSGDEIWVAAGTYKPTTGTDRSISFTLKNGVAVYGGFAGTETERTQRNFTTNITILSGDIGTAGINTDNSYHVVIGSNTNSTTLLDGFTITKGYADTPSSSGGGLYNYLGSPTLSNLIFKENSAMFGGGMYSEGEFSGYIVARPTLTNVTFINNTGRGEGGGMENRQYSQPTLTNVVFIGNTSNRSGGGMLNLSYCDSILTNVTFDNNTAVAGGGLSNLGSNSTLTNVTFSNNSSTEWAGGMDNAGPGNSTLTNVTFSGNSAGTDGGAIFNHYNATLTITNATVLGNSAVVSGDGVYTDNSPLIIRNSIIFGNGEEIYGPATVTYSIVQGGYTGVGNLNTDPLLGSLANNGGFTKTIALSSDSPAIDAGDDTVCPKSDQRGVTRPQGRHCDIGAYEEIIPTHPVIKSRAIYPSSITTQSGMTEGSISNLSLLDQTGTANNPASYVSFQTPQGAYVGYQSFILPENTDGRMISTMLLQVNFKVPSSPNQVWTWSIYDPTSNMWINLGSSTSADLNPNVWHSLVFRIRQPWKFVLSTNEIRIQLRSNNTNGDLLIDYEALHITYLSTPNTPVAPPVNTRRSGGF